MPVGSTCTRNTLRLLAFFCIFGGASAAADYCSLIVEVTAPNGKKPAANIMVTEQNGRELYQLAEGRDAQFCDLGLRPVTVKVGGDRTCDQVIIRDVPLYWQKTKFLKVIYDIIPCLVDSPHVFRFCTYLFRVSEPGGKWIPSASIMVMPGDRTLKTDTSGRVRVDVRPGAITASISAPEYTTQTFDGTCTAEKAAEPQEILIRLIPK